MSGGRGDEWAAGGRGELAAAALVWVGVQVAAGGSGWAEPAGIENGVSALFGVVAVPLMPTASAAHAATATRHAHDDRTRPTAM